MGFSSLAESWEVLRRHLPEDEIKDLPGKSQTLWARSPDMPIHMTVTLAVSFIPSHLRRVAGVVSFTHRSLMLGPCGQGFHYFIILQRPVTSAREMCSGNRVKVQQRGGNRSVWSAFLVWGNYMKIYIHYHNLIQKL